MSGVLRVLFVEPPPDIVNKPKNTVATVKSIAAMMTTTNKSIVRLPEQFFASAALNISTRHLEHRVGKLYAAVHTQTTLGADSREKLICCAAISLERQH
jgi:hypothetical protein